MHVGFAVHDIKTAAGFLLLLFVLFLGGGGCFATIFCSVISLCLLAYQTTYKHLFTKQYQGGHICIYIKDI
jgi:hypothetical protein